MNDMTNYLNYLNDLYRLDIVARRALRRERHFRDRINPFEFYENIINFMNYIIDLIYS